ncbi:MAG: hypothetical protein L0332_09820 [Chloroflexi bacterium]|nr:hypothetical protein [Chloroflexota bacterium]MCI0577194.1 hypothetical protein [Chloroflexota bacterium]MCI0649096.1 hypothetical protein [Chloroflexota bacterium]MCI0727002.1 hypothetical protein [Chloroflexota bacterium]
MNNTPLPAGYAQARSRDRPGRWQKRPESGANHEVIGEPYSLSTSAIAAEGDSAAGTGRPVQPDIGGSDDQGGQQAN